MAAILLKQRIASLSVAESEMRKLEESASQHRDMATCIAELTNALHEDPVNRAKIDEILSRYKSLIERERSAATSRQK